MHQARIILAVHGFEASVAQAPALRQTTAHPGMLGLRSFEFTLHILYGGSGAANLLRADILFGPP